MKYGDEENVSCVKEPIEYIHISKRENLFTRSKLEIDKESQHTWKMFLEDLTKNLHLKSYAVREIKSPHMGSRIRTLDDLDKVEELIGVLQKESCSNVM